MDRKAANITVVLAYDPVTKPNLHATHEYNRIQPHEALSIDLITRISVTRHLKNVTSAQIFIKNMNGEIVAGAEFSDRFRGNVNKGHIEELTIMTVYRPQGCVISSQGNQTPYKLICEPEMTSFPKTSVEPHTLTGEKKYSIMIDILHAKGNDTASFIVDLSLDILHPINITHPSPLVQTEKPTFARSTGFFAAP